MIAMGNHRAMGAIFDVALVVAHAQLALGEGQEMLDFLAGMIFDPEVVCYEIFAGLVVIYAVANSEPIVTLEAPALRGMGTSASGSRQCPN
jgi:hypothetical protein